MKKRKNNNGIFYVVIALVAIIGIGNIVKAYTGQNNGTVIENQVVQGNYVATPVADIVIPSLGAAAGPDHYFHNRFISNYSVGGQNYATSSIGAAYTLTTLELPADRETGYISWTVNIENITLTTMASSSAPLADLKIGESYSTYLYSATSTAASTITLAAGTGVDLQEDEAGSVVVNGLELSKLTFLKKADTDVILLVEPYQVAD